MNISSEYDIFQPPLKDRSGFAQEKGTDFSAEIQQMTAAKNEDPTFGNDREFARVSQYAGKELESEAQREKHQLNSLRTEVLRSVTLSAEEQPGRIDPAGEQLHKDQ